jgi:hypothetical protein
MRIGIDMSRTAETKTGLASYAISLVTALARVARLARPGGKGHNRGLDELA